MMSLWIAQASAAAEAPSAGGGWLIDPELVDPAYSQTIAGGEIQTAFPPPPPPPPPTPEWLKSLFDMIGSFFQWSAPAAKPLLWVGVALLALFLLYHFVPAFARWVDNLPFRRKAGEDDAADDIGLAEAGAARAMRLKASRATPGRSRASARSREVIAGLTSPGRRPSISSTLR